MDNSGGSDEEEQNNRAARVAARLEQIQRDEEKRRRDAEIQRTLEKQREQEEKEREEKRKIEQKVQEERKQQEEKKVREKDWLPEHKEYSVSQHWTDATRITRVNTAFRRVVAAAIKKLMSIEENPHLEERKNKVIVARKNRKAKLGVTHGFEVGDAGGYIAARTDSLARDQFRPTGGGKYFNRAVDKTGTVRPYMQIKDVKDVPFAPATAKIRDAREPQGDGYAGYQVDLTYFDPDEVALLTWEQFENGDYDESLPLGGVRMVEFLQQMDIKKASGMGTIPRGIAFALQEEEKEQAKGQKRPRSKSPTLPGRWQAARGDERERGADRPQGRDRNAEARQRLADARDKQDQGRDMYKRGNKGDGRQ